MRARARGASIGSCQPCASAASTSCAAMPCSIEDAAQARLRRSRRASRVSAASRLGVAALVGRRLHEPRDSFAASRRSSRICQMPIAARRKPERIGASRVGSRPTAKQPTIVSILSASATSAASSVVGSSAPCPLGHQCCSIASATASGSPTKPRVVLAHRALQLGELADRERREICLAQCAARRGSRSAEPLAELCTILTSRRDLVADRLRAVAELGLEHDAVELCVPVRRTMCLLILGEEELRVG